MTRGAYEDNHENRASELATKALELARQIGDKVVQSGALNILAEVAGSAGDEATERQLYEESLALRRELGDRRLIANSVLTLGRAELTRGEYERATPLLQEGFALAKELRDTWSMSLALIYLGRVALQSGGDAGEASWLFAEALALAKERGDKRVAAECLQGLAAVLGLRGDGVQAARLFGAGEGILEAIGATPSSSEIAISERYVPPVKEALGDERFDAEWAAGHSTPPDEAIDVALASCEPTSAGAAPALLGNSTSTA
jgi:tetratricopeptide (TPR) repeat protein